MNGLLRFLARHTLFVEDEILGLDAVVRPGDVCLDVGAEYGLYTHAFAKLVGPTGMVHSVEPLSGAFRVLSAGVMLCQHRNVRCYQIALGQHAERGMISVPRRCWVPVHGRAFLVSGANGQGPNVEFASSRTVEVDVLTLDELCARERIHRVDFVKLDIEGAELAVLRGSEATLAAQRPTLLIEIEQRHVQKFDINTTDVISYLTARGYRMHVWHNDAWSITDRVTITQRNYLFSHPDRLRSAYAEQSAHRRSAEKDSIQ